MSATTKHKLEFTHAMARHTRATVRQCEALMRYAGTLQRLAEWERNEAMSDIEHNAWAEKCARIRQKVTELCEEIRASETFSLRYALSNIETNLTGRDYPHERWNSSLKYAKEALAGEYSDSALGECCVPVFSGDPRGCVLKIRVPDGFSDTGDGEGIGVPA